MLKVGEVQLQFDAKNNFAQRLEASWFAQEFFQRQFSSLCIVVIVAAVILAITVAVRMAAAALPPHVVPSGSSAAPLPQEKKMSDDTTSTSGSLTREEEKTLASAEEYRKLGNKLFTEKHFDTAYNAYTKAIELCFRLKEPAVLDVCHLYLSNRAQCSIKLENYGLAIEDATKAVELKPNFSKGFYRRGCANIALQKFQQALKDFQTSFNFQPTPEASLRIKECHKEIRSQRFKEAIAGPAVTVDIETVIKFYGDTEWKGPRFRKDAAFLKALLDHLRTPGNTVHKVDAYQILTEIRELLSALPTLVEIEVEGENSKFTVCGDVHGQFYDLCNIFEINGLPSEENPYLFNGDFVDRGSFSTECIYVLFTAKLIWPKHVHLARGNHETRNMNSLYGFQGEVLGKYCADDSRYASTLYSLFCDCFRALPLAHVINNKAFVVHGGLFSHDGVTLDDIRRLDRQREPPEDGIMVDLLWSDPQPMNGRSASKRGVACCFGPDVTKKFLEKNNLDCVIRSHEMKKNGYEIDHDNKLITVFSAPNYCDQMDNLGALIRFKGKDLEREFVTFAAVPHPDVPPMQYASPFCSLLQ